MPRSRRYLVIALTILGVMAGVRLALPSIVKSYVNRTLSTMEAYRGSVEDIDIQLLRGAYRIVGLTIEKVSAKDKTTPFFQGDVVDLAVEWPSLFKGSVVAEAEFVRPVINLVQSDNKQQSQLGTEQNWVDTLKELAPMRFNTIAVTDGQVTFRVPGIRVKDALHAQHVNGHITNLTNVVAKEKETFADFALAGTVLGNAPLSVSGSINPLANTPAFDVNLALKNVDITMANPWLREFIKADAESGQFELYIEMAAANNRFKGYAKPLMHNVDIARAEENKGKPLKRLWETLVDAATKIFENKSTDQVAARIPFSGTIEDPKAGIFAAMVSVLRNAFIGAFSRSLEGSISLYDVKKDLREIDKKDGLPPEAKESKQDKKR